METTPLTSGKCKHAGQMNPQPSSYAAQNAATHSENTHKPSENHGKILNVALNLQKLGYSEAYLKTMVKALMKISRNVDIDNPSEVLTYIAKLKAMDSYKANLCDFYSHYARQYGIPFVKPKFRRDHKLPYIPSKEELELFIAHSKKKYALIYSILRDTGIRPVELSRITLRDIDLDKGTINII